MKKSENIEIRIDHETKRALHQKAEAEQRSVSTVLRGLIQGYLEPAPNSVQIGAFKFRQYGGWATALLVLAFSGLNLIPAANAENLKLDFKGEILTQQGDDQSLRTIDSVVEFDHIGGTVNLPAGASDVVFELTIKAVTLDGNRQGADMRIKIINIDGPDRNVLAEPHLIGELGEVSRIEIGSEQGTVYKINLVPSAVD